MSETTTIATSPPSEPPLPSPVSRRNSIFPPSPIDDELRLSTTFASRILLGMSFAFIGGGILGGYQGSTMASLRFRAENSHRFPTTTTGWYLYHKSKNYRCMLQAIKDGLRFGPRIAGWTGAFFFLEEAVDHWRGRRDAISSAVAALTVSSIFSYKHGFNIATTVRTARVGLVASLGYGVTQDLMALAKGRRVVYIDALFRKHSE